MALKSSKSKKFVYKGRDVKSIKARANQSGGSYDNYFSSKVQRFKIENGTSNIRILPPSPDIDQDKWGDQWGIEIWTHDFIGPDNSNFLCLRKMKGEVCPVCEEFERADAEAEDDKEHEEARKFRPKKRILTYIIDRDDEKAGPLIWSMPWTVEKDIQARSSHKKTGEGILIDDPDEGFDLSFERTGKGRQIKYLGIDIARDSSPISDDPDVQEKWLDFIEKYPLPEILEFKDADYMEKVFMGKKAKKDEDEEDEDEDEDEKKSKKKPSKKDADEDEETESEDDDEEDDEKPKGKKRKPSEDEEEEEETEDEEEEDEKPKKRKPSKDEDEEEEEDDDEDEKPSKRKSSKDDDGDDDDNDTDKEEEEDEDEKPSKSTIAKKKIERLKRKQGRK